VNQFAELADLRILLWLNHWFSSHPTLYKTALFLTDEGSDIAVVATGALLWFWPWRQRRLGDTDRRLDSRARLLVFGAAAMAAYVVARMIAVNFDAPRPFVTYLPLRGTEGAFDGLRTFGTFPSDHAALLGALPPAVLYWSRPLAAAWFALALVFISIRVGVGYHYPSDMIVGALIGMSLATLGMVLYDNSRSIFRLANNVAAGFSRTPEAYFLYALLALVGVEFAMHFSHVLWFLLVVQGWLS